MTESESKLFGVEFIGIVEENKDPDKKQRVQIRIPYLHGSKDLIPTEALPWAQPYRDNSGISYSVPEINKIVNVTFPTGNPYYPVYKNAQHLNINLQKKIEQYDGDDYASFVALCYNYNTQIYVDKNGLLLQYELNGLKIDDEEIIINRKNPTIDIKLGNEKADEGLILGNTFIKWLDSFVDVLTNAYIGNSGAPVVANPELMKVIASYKQNKKDFLSETVFVINNRDKTNNISENISQIGDKYTFSKDERELNINQQQITEKEIVEAQTTTESNIESKVIVIDKNTAITNLTKEELEIMTDPAAQQKEIEKLEAQANNTPVTPPVETNSEEDELSMLFYEEEQYDTYIADENPIFADEDFTYTELEEVPPNQATTSSGTYNTNKTGGSTKPPKRGKGINMSGAEMEYTFGVPNKAGKGYITYIKSPFTMYYEGKPLKKLAIHKLIADKFLAALTDILNYYGEAEIKRLGINKTGGTFNYRLMRGGSSLSMHSWGTAIDLDPANNTFKGNSKNSTFAKPEYKKMIDIFYKHGFISLGKEFDYDWMHFEYSTKLLPI